MNNTTPPFNDLKVRQAVNYAIDPAALERIYGGRLIATQQILPPGMPGYKKYKLYPHDLDKAKALIWPRHTRPTWTSPSGRTTSLTSEADRRLLPGRAEPARASTPS